MNLHKLWHHLFILPIYLSLVAGVVGTAAAVVGIAWACYLYWEQVLFVASAIAVIVWFSMASDYVVRKGWRYRPKDLATQDNEECKKDQS